MLGGMRAVTWTQIAQYIVLIVAYLVPIIILSTQKYGIPIPELTYGQAIAGHHRARAADAADRACHGGGPQAAHPALHQLQPAELLRHHLLHDGRHGFAAAHPDALLHDAVGARSAPVGRLVAAVHLPALLLGAGLRGVLEARGVHQHHRPGPRQHPALDVHLGRARPDPDLRQERSERAGRSSTPARRSPAIPGSCGCRTSSSTRT